MVAHPMWLRPGQGNTAPVPDGALKLAAIQSFLDYAMSKPDVWMVTHQQLIQYMQNPVPASQLSSQSYMQCNQAPKHNLQWYRDEWGHALDCPTISFE